MLLSLLGKLPFKGGPSTTSARTISIPTLDYTSQQEKRGWRATTMRPSSLTLLLKSLDELFTPNIFKTWHQVAKIQLSMAALVLFSWSHEDLSHYQFNAYGVDASLLSATCFPLHQSQGREGKRHQGNLRWNYQIASDRDTVPRES